MNKHKFITLLLLAVLALTGAHLIDDMGDATAYVMFVVTLVLLFDHMER